MEGLDDVGGVAHVERVLAVQVEEVLDGGRDLAGFNVVQDDLWGKSRRKSELDAYSRMLDTRYVP